MAKNSFDVATGIEQVTARAESLCWFVGTMVEQAGRDVPPELEHAVLLTIDLMERLQAVTATAYEVARSE